LAHAAARKFNDSCGLTFQERRSAAYLGLIHAAKRFDPTKEFQFSTYAVRCAINYIQREIWANNIIRIPSYLREPNSANPSVKGSKDRYQPYAKAGRSVGSFDRGDSVSRIDPEDYHVAAPADPDEPDPVERLETLISWLPEAQRWVTSERLTGRTLTSIGTSLGCTRHIVAKIYQDSLKQLRDMAHADQ
jgi:RNA polymerase sigma factor (sigma-70 family)